MSVSKWVKDNGKALGYAAAGVAVPTAMHMLFDTKFGEHSVYQMTDSAARFLNYGLTAVAFGKALQTAYEDNAGRKATPVEKVGLYACGAIAATGLWEGWENVGQAGPIQNALHQTFGEYAKTGFPGLGRESFSDAALTVAGTTTAAAANEARKYVSGLLRKE